MLARARARVRYLADGFFFVGRPCDGVMFFFLPSFARRYNGFLALLHKTKRSESNVHAPARRPFLNGELVIANKLNRLSVCTALMDLTPTRDRRAESLLREHTLSGIRFYPKYHGIPIACGAQAFSFNI